MNKINGYTEEEAKKLVNYVSEGKRKGATLSELFAGYAKKTGRAKGSVRNYYYALLRCTGDARVKSMLRGKNLRAEKIVPFSEGETDELLKSILLRKQQGYSVRRAVSELAGGDAKLTLRYQNKYRNVLTRQPERIERLMREAGIYESDEQKRRLEEEINGLYDRLASGLKEENRRLAALIKKLTDENALLKLQIKNMD